MPAGVDRNSINSLQLVLCFYQKKSWWSLRHLKDVSWKRSWERLLEKVLRTSPGRRLYPLGTERKLNVHKTFRRGPGRLLNVLCTFNIRFVSRGFTMKLPWKGSKLFVTRRLISQNWSVPLTVIAAEKKKTSTLTLILIILLTWPLINFLFLK